MYTNKQLADALAIMPGQTRLHDTVIWCLDGEGERIGYLGLVCAITELPNPWNAITLFTAPNDLRSHRPFRRADIAGVVADVRPPYTPSEEQVTSQKEST